jgi:hypothetical protein
MAKDFIGNELKQGDFVAYPGAGNAKAEYGHILYKVLESKEDSVKAVRLHCSWSQSKDSLDAHPKTWLKNKCLSQRNVLIHRMDSTITNTNKLVKVNPSEEVSSLFDRVLDKDETLCEEINLEDIGYWIHGGDANPFQGRGFRKFDDTKSPW